MEIKQGDKVKVSEDAPKMCADFKNLTFRGKECEVRDTEKDVALIEIKGNGTDRYQVVIPTKYLVKVDAEAKEPRFKKGDKVRYIGNIQEHKGEMFVIDGDIFFNDYYKQWQASSIKTTPTEVWGICNVPLSDLEPDTKPTEQTEAHTDANEKLQEEYMRFMKNMCEVHDTRIRQIEAEPDKFRKAELDRMLHPEKYYTYEETIDNAAMNWQRYEADLAKELAIAYAKRGENPLDAAAAAKEITKRLKQK